MSGQMQCVVGRRLGKEWMTDGVQERFYTRKKRVIEGGAGFGIMTQPAARSAGQ